MTTVHKAQFNPPLVRSESVKDKNEAKYQRRYGIIIFAAEDLIKIFTKADSNLYTQDIHNFYPSTKILLHK